MVDVEDKSIAIFCSTTVSVVITSTCLSFVLMVILVRAIDRGPRSSLATFRAAVSRATAFYF